VSAIPVLFFGRCTLHIRESNPLLDIRYWALLNDVITHTNNRTTRPVKKWLISLLARIPIAPTVISFFDMLPTLEEDRCHEVTLVVCRCIVIIWPLSAPKFSPDSLIDCLGAILKLLPMSAADESLAQIGCLVASSYRSYQANSPYSRKACHVFLDGLADCPLKLVNSCYLCSWKHL
jgi:hypothetical protein